MQTTRKLTARLALTLVVLVVGLLGVATAPASAAPDLGVENTAKPEVLKFQQYRNRVNFNWWISTTYSVASFTVEFEGQKCNVARGQFNDYRCTIFDTGNAGGTATLSKNMTNGTVVEVSSVEIEALPFGACGAAVLCPTIEVTQFPDEVHFFWLAQNRVSANWILSFAGQTCTRGHGQPNQIQGFGCVLTDTNDAGGIVTLTLSDRYDTLVHNEINIEPLGPGKCGATPRCVDAPINFTATTKSMTEVALDWQNHDGSETHVAGWKVEAKPDGGKWSAVCTGLVRDYSGQGGLAATECVVDNLKSGTNYSFRVASSGAGRAFGMASETTAATMADHELSYQWRAEPNGTLYLGLTWKPTIAPRVAHRVEVDNVGGCGGEGECEIRVSKATGDALPNTFKARLIQSAGTVTNTIQTITVTPPPAQPHDPVNLEVDASKTTATVSWNHPRNSTAVRYGVWLSGPGLPTCEVTSDLGGRESCRLKGLTPGTSYQVHVYGEDAIGQRSETSPSITFVTNKDAKVEPPKEDPKIDPPKVDPPKDDPKDDEPKVDPKVAKCAPDGKFTKARDRVVNKVNVWYEKQVNKATDRLDHKPKKLARKITKLGATRDNKIAKAEAKYIGRCG